jgi:hypothetical protein
MDLFPHTTQAPRRRHGAGLWAVVVAFAAVMAFSTVPTPLYTLYQARDGFSTFVIAVIFAAYAVGVIVALFFAGHISDWVGRRRVLVPAILLSVASAAVFLVWRTLPGLLVGRVLSGVSVGVVTATATAYLGELHLGERPGASPARAQLLATTANLGGLGLGALLAGLLAQCVGAPLTVPFVLFLVVLTAGALAVAFAPETVTRPSTRPAYRAQRVAVPAEVRGRFLGAAASAAVAFAAFGLFTSLAPTFLAVTLGHTSHALAGVPAFTAFTAAAVAQRVARAWDIRRVIMVGAAAMSAGVLLVVAATWLVSLPPFLAGGVGAGAGAGLLFKGGVVAVAGLAAPDRRAEALAGFFLAGYVGISVPVLGLGVLDQWVAPKVALLAFAATLLAGLARSVRTLLVGERRAPGRRRPLIPSTEY